MKTFKTNSTYTTRFIGDADSVLNGLIIKRTAKTVTIDTGSLNGVKRCKIHSFDGVEKIWPCGKYSMAPIFSADRIAA